ncbi:purine-nucleoside phosphorylase [Turneriella parva]|uniref:Purine nucleoside phosphorylase n=1 Tax=Turneriella parva (strain ATCC BAA-1111 / DSM 21527 / NCTC 11395 / H) TaxID=869212 RepID=I4BBA0_TURPD|nr:purine-nucleoside phosphorylase [Turneriella parva]AFM14557.1 inosine guanosine and xanthosine phosphorylase family [Turneriella parva DSM 21527]
MIQISPQEIESAANVLRARINFPLQVGIVLGSGLSDMAERAEKSVAVPYAAIPGFPQSTVEGHVGRFVGGFIEEASVLMMQGRVHYYEGYAMQQVSFGIRLMAALGVRTLILTNAAGAVNMGYKPGDFMLIQDHINFMSANPLIGKHHAEWGERFVDQSETYTGELLNRARGVGKALGIPLREGVYAGLTGPTYETPAEIRMLRTLGADACGMSTVPEAIVARQCGMRVLGISVITNMGAGIAAPLHHSEVVEIAEKRKIDFQNFLFGIIRSINAE